MAVADGDETKRSLRSTVGKLSTLQERFEASRAGKVVISGLVAAVVVTGVVSNLPDSPIKRSLMPVVKPLAMPMGLDQGWAMYAPNPNRRLETVEVHVRMADGENRVWTMEPGDRGIGWWDRWLNLRYAALANPSVRPELARWVARELTEPTEHAVSVAVILHAKTLSPPGESAGDATARKILYQENLAGQR